MWDKKFLDDEVKRSEYTYRTVDEPRIKETEANADLAVQKIKENKFTIVALVALLVFTMIFVIIILFVTTLPTTLEKMNSIKLQEQGYISAGWYKDYLDQDYEFVEAQMEALGFTDIKTIDLDDADEEHKENTVKIISVKGNTEFDDDDYFSPEDKVVIAYR